ncbi:MAG: hypothetical protein RLZZ28_338 [Bacteroidota bacterium]|jgi:uncharacterized protein
MKNKIFLLTILVLFGFRVNAQTKSFIDQPYIEVNGIGDSLVVPNEIYIRIILSEKDSRDKISLEESEKKMVTTLAGLGLNTEKDLSTTDMMSNYQAYLLKKKGILKTKEYLLKVSDANTAGKVFIKMEEAGLANCSIDKVSHSNLEGIKNDCRSKAVKNALERAKALVQPLGQSVKNALHIVDLENSYNYPEARAANIRIRGMASNDAVTEDSPIIDFEKIKIRISVTVKFVLL